MGLTNLKTNDIFKKEEIGNVRKAQEDSHDYRLDTPNGHVFVVCDGMGGHVGGKQASTIAVNSILEYLEKEAYPQPIEALKGAIEFANTQILGYAALHPELIGMGTTACILLLQETKAYIAHVGDSRIYLFLEKEKELRRITKDHSFVQTLVDAGEITDDEAEHHPMKNRILKALGVKREVEPSTAFVLPKNGDTFLICSDGLCGMISDLRIKAVLDSDASLKEKGDAMINLALEAGGYDNITLEMIRISDSLHAVTESPNYNPGISGSVAGRHETAKKESDEKPQGVNLLIKGLDGRKKIILIFAACFVLLVGLAGVVRYPKIYYNSLKNKVEGKITYLEGLVTGIDNKMKGTEREIESNRNTVEQLNESTKGVDDGNAQDTSAGLNQNIENDSDNLSELNEKKKTLEGRIKELKKILNGINKIEKPAWPTMKELKVLKKEFKDESKKEFKEELKKVDSVQSGRRTKVVIIQIPKGTQTEEGEKE